MKLIVKEIGKVFLFVFLVLLSIPIIGLIFWNIPLDELRETNPFKALYFDSIVWTIILIEIPIFYLIVHRNNLIKSFMSQSDKGFKKMIFAGLISLVLFELFEWILSFVFNGRFAIINSDFKLLIFLNSIYLVFITALIEEYFYRVYFTERLKKIGLSNIYIVLITAVIFTLGHIGNRYNTLGYVSIFVDGVLYSLIYLRTKNIWYSVGIHYFTNYAMMFLVGFETYSYFRPGFNSTDLINLIRDILFAIIMYFIVIRIDKVLAPTKNIGHWADDAKFEGENIY